MLNQHVILPTNLAFLILPQVLPLVFSEKISCNDKFGFDLEFENVLQKAADQWSLENQNSRLKLINSESKIQLLTNPRKCLRSFKNSKTNMFIELSCSATSISKFEPTKFGGLKITTGKESDQCVCLDFNSGVLISQKCDENSNCQKLFYEYAEIFVKDENNVKQCLIGSEKTTKSGKRYSQFEVTACEGFKISAAQYQHFGEDERTHNFIGIIGDKFDESCFERIKSKAPVISKNSESVFHNGQLKTLVQDARYEVESLDYQCLHYNKIKKGFYFGNCDSQNQLDKFQPANNSDVGISIIGSFKKEICLTISRDKLSIAYCDVNSVNQRFSVKNSKIGMESEDYCIGGGRLEDDGLVRAEVVRCSNFDQLIFERSVYDGFLEGVPMVFEKNSGGGQIREKEQTTVPATTTTTTTSTTTTTTTPCPEYWDEPYTTYVNLGAELNLKSAIKNDIPEFFESLTSNSSLCNPCGGTIIAKRKMLDCNKNQVYQTDSEGSFPITESQYYECPISEEFVDSESECVENDECSCVITKIRDYECPILDDKIEEITLEKGAHWGEFTFTIVKNDNMPSEDYYQESEEVVLEF